MWIFLLIIDISLDSKETNVKWTCLDSDPVLQPRTSNATKAIAAQNKNTNILTNQYIL